MRHTGYYMHGESEGKNVVSAYLEAMSEDSIGKTKESNEEFSQPTVSRIGSKNCIYSYYNSILDESLG
jgi:hypothetical protein